MRRDWSLVRKILLNVRDGNKAESLSDYQEEAVSYHRWLVVDGGLADGMKHEDKAYGPEAGIYTLTLKGHDFLAWAEDPFLFAAVIAHCTENNLPQSSAFLEAVSRVMSSRLSGDLMGITENLHTAIRAICEGEPRLEYNRRVLRWVQNLEAERRAGA